jgi:hypothetical protein
MVPFGLKDDGGVTAGSDCVNLWRGLDGGGAWVDACSRMIGPAEVLEFVDVARCWWGARLVLVRAGALGGVWRRGSIHRGGWGRGGFGSVGGAGVKDGVAPGSVCGYGFDAEDAGIFVCDDDHGGG